MRSLESPRVQLDRRTVFSLSYVRGATEALQFSEDDGNTPLETENDVTINDIQKKPDQRQAGRANPLNRSAYLFASIRRPKNKSARRGNSAGGRVAVSSSKVKMHQGTTVRCRFQIRPGPLRTSPTWLLIDDVAHRSSQQPPSPLRLIGDSPVRGATEAHA